MLLFVGFNCTFFVQFLLGDQGQPRGASTFSEHGSTAAYNMISTIGAFATAVGVLSLPARRRAGDKAAGGPATILAGRHARVVHDLAAAAAQLRLVPPSRAHGRSHDLRRS